MKRISPVKQMDKGPMVSNYEIGAQSLIERGYAVLEDDGNLLPLVQAAFSEGLRFFSQADKTKRDASVSKIIEGFLPMMSEFSVSELRPDLCEGFAVWRRNADDPDVNVGLQTPRFTWL